MVIFVYETWLQGIMVAVFMNLGLPGVFFFMSTGAMIPCMHVSCYCYLISRLFSLEKCTSSWVIPQYCFAHPYCARFLRH